MSATADVVDEAERLARVKLSCGIEPGTPRIAALVSELDAGVVLDYLEEVADVDGRIVASRRRSRSSRRPVASLGERAPKIGFRLVHELAANGYPVAVTCRVLKVSRSGYPEWRDRPPSKQDLDDAYLANTIVDIYAMSRASTAPDGSTPNYDWALVSGRAQTGSPGGFG